MIGLMMLEALASVAAVAVAMALLALVFRFHARRFDILVARDLLRSWENRLELLEPERRAHERMSPPAGVLDAMVTVR